MVTVVDPSTYSNYTEVRADHYNLDWNVDFESKAVVGSVKIDFTVLKATNRIVLDGRDLAIESVSHDNEKLNFVSEKNGLGDRITIEKAGLEPEQKLTLLVNYKTGENASALQFMKPEQTTDRKGPFLFSQCEAIHARSILPCMDTPSVKSSYEAKVNVPQGLTCLMSAILEKTDDSNGLNQFWFNQKVPIPSYLIAIVVGLLEKRDISDRCAVWAEPSVADSARWEFESTETFLQTAEELAGKYVWGRYDMVVLPATFPFGGMENPCLTFVTPTLLAGDRSLVNVVAHEISHSWTGNLVTNASWEHFWLNEGFTVFLERKIHGRVNGELDRQFESERGYDEALVNAVETFGRDHEFTKLLPDLKTADPDDAFSSVPYEKGSALLFTLDQKLGNSERFEEFLRTYIKKHAYKTVTTDVWKADLYEYFADKKSILDEVDWNKWLHAPGLPPKPKYDTTLMEACKALSDQWLSASPPQDPTAFFAMSSSQKVAVLDIIRTSGKFEVAKLPSMTTTYDLVNTKNCEIRFKWLMLGLDLKWQNIIKPALDFVLTVGRLKYCKPIYSSLFKWPLSRASAVDQFNRNRANMHPITAGVIAKLLD